MARAIWKGAISFGLVHIPVGLVSAASPQGVDFSWLDKRSMDPVGYKRINKATGKEVTSEDIVKGVQYEKGRYVVLSEEEIRDAHPRATQTIDIRPLLGEVDGDRPPYPAVRPGDDGDTTLQLAGSAVGIGVVDRLGMHAVLPAGPLLLMLRGKSLLGHAGPPGSGRGVC